MKAINIDGQIMVFQELPVDWKHYLNFKEAPVDLQQQEGFFDVVEPIFDPVIQQLGDLFFEISNKVFTYPVLDRVLPLLAEAKALKIAELKKAIKPLYSTIQWLIEAYGMEEAPIPTEIKDKIRLIRIRYDQAKNQIIELTAVREVLLWQIPFEQINNLKNELEQLG